METAKKKAAPRKKSPVKMLEEVLKQLEEGSMPYKYVVKAIDSLGKK